MRHHWGDIQKLVEKSKKTRAANNKVIHYVLEAQRISLNIPLVRQYVSDGSLNPEILVADPHHDHFGINGHGINGTTKTDGEHHHHHQHQVQHRPSNGEQFLLEIVSTPFLSSLVMIKLLISPCSARQ